MHNNQRVIIMKNQLLKQALCIVLSVVLLHFGGTVFAENIDGDDDGFFDAYGYAYGENIGWINFKPSRGPGVTVTDSAVTGYAWGENVGWISLSCENTFYCDTVDYGVVNDGCGNLSGYAWGENIGWINFAPPGGGVFIYPNTGIFFGHAWGENIGWINFAPSKGAVRTSWNRLFEGGFTDTPAASLTASDAAVIDYFGNSVAISGDTLVVGAHKDRTRPGSAYVFSYNGTGWVEEPPLTTSDPAVYDYFGNSVAISGDIVVVGVPHDDLGVLYNAGSAYVFQLSGGVWTRKAKLTASDAAKSDRFGYSVAIDGDTIVVGALSSGSLGRAYVFQRNGETWPEERILTGDDIADNDNFGNSVAIFGDIVVVGAPRHDAGGKTGTGAAYVFERNGGTWPQKKKLTASEAGLFDWFGTSVAIDGDTIVVGRPNVEGSEYGGAAHVFKYDGNTWIQEAKLTASNAYSHNYLGTSVAIDGGLIVVGVGEFLSEPGVAYVFQHDGVNWTEKAKLVADGRPAQVDISGNRIVVGQANAWVDGVGEAGAAYVYELAYETPIGDCIVAQPVDTTTGMSPVTLTFSEVTQEGTTSLTSSSNGPSPPSGFQLGDPPTYYELTTEAVIFSGLVTVCIDYSGVDFGDETQLQLKHAENGEWVDATLSLDTKNNIICGNVDSLSPFAIFEPVAVDPDGDGATDTEKAKVSWHHDDLHVEGNMYFPEGVGKNTLSPAGGAEIVLAGVGVANQNVIFEIKGKKGDKWEYKDKQNVYGNIKEFKIEWKKKAPKFNYKGDLHIHTHSIAENETTLCVHSEHVSGAFTVVIDYTAITYNENGSITTDVDHQPQKGKNSHVHFTLPFQLTPDMPIEVAGSVELSLNVADYYEKSYAKFKLVSVFDPYDFDGTISLPLPDTLEYFITLGDDANEVSWNDLIDDTMWTKQDDKHWEYKPKKPKK
jgi:hypothetical protein